MSTSSEKVNYYTILQLPQNCTLKEISASYRKLVLLHHPDKTGNDKTSFDTFCQIQEAGEVLRDPLRRRLYDERLGLDSIPDDDSELGHKPCNFSEPKYENPWVNSKPTAEGKISPDEKGCLPEGVSECGDDFW
ncbi:hypothetical protein N7454_009166 [Penicillium verhagenii]|nr:hypothetical protein N7454_009166 [Penicillium verhagenii]